MTRWKQRAAWLRWAMLVVGLLLFGGAVTYMLSAYWDWTAGIVWTPLSPWLTLGLPTGSDTTDYAFDVGMWIGLFLLTQWLFLRPRRGWAVRLTARGRPMKRSIVAAALVAMLISAGLIAALVELPDWWERWVFDGTDGPRFWPVWIAMGVMWVVWGVVFYIYWRRGDEFTRLSRMTRGLFAGSVLELFVATAIYVWNPHQQRDCYCARGSYTGLIFGGTALIWCFGPGVALLFVRERYRAASQHCSRCGYDLRGTIAGGKSACPECGEAISFS